MRIICLFVGWLVGCECRCLGRSARLPFVAFLRLHFGGTFNHTSRCERTAMQLIELHIWNFIQFAVSLYRGLCSGFYPTVWVAYMRMSVSKSQIYQKKCKFSDFQHFQKNIALNNNNNKNCLRVSASVYRKCIFCFWEIFSLSLSTTRNAKFSDHLQMQPFQRNDNKQCIFTNVVNVLHSIILISIKFICMHDSIFRLNFMLLSFFGFSFFC